MQRYEQKSEFMDRLVAVNRVSKMPYHTKPIAVKYINVV